MNERVLNTHSKGERVKIPLLPKQSKIKGARQRQWSRQHLYQCKVSKWQYFSDSGNTNFASNKEHFKILITHHTEGDIFMLC